MKNRISINQSSIENKSYTQLEQLFEMHLNGLMVQELTRLNLTDIEILEYRNKGQENSIQVYFKYYNLVCTIIFSHRKYEYVVYEIGDTFDQIKDSFIEREYEREFSLRSLLHFIHQKLKLHSSLNLDTAFMIRRKKYRRIADICLIVPFVIIGVLSIYVLATKETITMSPYFILIILIPTILWLVFYTKSTKTR